METKVQVLFGQQKQTFAVKPEYPLGIILEFARREWSIDAALALRLFEKKGAVLSPEFVDLQQSFANAGLSRCTLVVDYAPEASAAVAELNAKKQRLLDEKQREEDERLRAVDPVAAFRADLRRHAQTLEQVYTHADEAQLHRLFNTEGLLMLHNMTCGAIMVDPATATGINREMHQKYGTCIDDGESWCSSKTREIIVAKTMKDMETGGVPKFVPKSPSHIKTSPPPASEIAKNLSPHRPQEAVLFSSPISVAPASHDQTAPSTGPSPIRLPQSPPPLTTIATWFGEIIQPSIRHEELPNVSGKVLVTSVQPVLIKVGEKEASECICELYIDEIATTGGKVVLQPQLRYKKKSQLAYISYNLWPHDIEIGDVCCPSDAPFSILLKLDQDVLMQFRSDPDVEKWERAIKHVYTYLSAFKRPDDGKTVGGGLTSAQLEMYREACKSAEALDPAEIEKLPEGLLFSRDATPIFEVSTQESLQDMDSLLLLQEHNAFVTYTDKKMSSLREEFAVLAANEKSHKRLEEICKELQELSVMNLELFKMIQERNRWQAWLDDPKNAKKPEWSKIRTRAEMLQLHIMRLTDEKLRYKPIISVADRKKRQQKEAATRLEMATKGKGALDIERALKDLEDKWCKEDNERIPFMYEDVLIQVGFDGISNGESFTALCVLPKHGTVCDIIHWLYHRVFCIDKFYHSSPSCPFVLYRNGLLCPDKPISSFASPPTAKIMCRVNASESPFRVQIKGSNEFSRFVRILFPTKKMTAAEENRIAKLKEDQWKEELWQSFQENLQKHPDTQVQIRLAADSNKLVLCRFCEKEGSFSCDQLRDFLNQGHFDDCTEFGKMMDCYEFSFDEGMTWLQYGLYSDLLSRINTEAIARTLNAVQYSLRAIVNAALMTFKQPGGINDVSMRNETNFGVLNFEVPLISHPEAQDSKQALEFFQEQISLADERRVSKGLTRLFASSHSPQPCCRVAYDPPGNPLKVTFFFPAFLNLDLIMRDKGGLQKELEQIIFNFYFQQKLAQPRGGEC